MERLYGSEVFWEGVPKIISSAAKASLRQAGRFVLAAVTARLKSCPPKKHRNRQQWVSAGNN
jgi:hypothetical protein